MNGREILRLGVRAHARGPLGQGRGAAGRRDFPGERCVVVRQRAYHVRRRRHDGGGVTSPLPAIAGRDEGSDLRLRPDRHAHLADALDLAFELVAGLRARCTPAGVPVMMMSPAASSTISESFQMISGTFQIICSRSPSCFTSPLHLEPDAALVRMADLGGRLERPARRRAVERLADLPRPLDVARGDLQVAARQVDADAVAPHAIERLVLRDVAAAGLERHHHLDLVMQVVGQRRVGHRAAVMHDRVGGLGEEERRLALVLAHLLDVLEIVAPDAPDAAHRKHLGRCRRPSRRPAVRAG